LWIGIAALANRVAGASRRGHKVGKLPLAADPPYAPASTSAAKLKPPPGEQAKRSSPTTFSPICLHGFLTGSSD